MRKSARMMNVVSAVEARTQFGQLRRRVTGNNERFVIDRRGQPQAIIMSLDDNVDAIAPESNWLTKIGDASKRRVPTSAGHPGVRSTRRKSMATSALS